MKDPVSCPEYHYCESGSPAPVRCKDGTYGNGTGLKSQEECSPCPEGSWCNSGRSFPCGNGTYADAPASSRTDRLACKPCDGNHTTRREGASSSADCICSQGYYRLNVSGSGDGICDDCPDGSICDDLGTTLETLVAQKDYWRPSTRTHEFKKCDYDTCRVRGHAADELCKSGFTGPYCELCVDNGTYFVGSSEGSHCRDCPEAGMYVVFYLALILAVLSVWWCCVRWSRRRASADRSTRQGPFERVSRAIDVMLAISRNAGSLANDNRTKIKIFWTFYSIVTHIEHTYDATYPEELGKMLSTFSRILRLNIDIPIIRLECLVTSGLAGQLRFAIITPIVICFGLVLIIKLRGKAPSTLYTLS